MNKKYSSLLGYINGVVIGTLIGFSIYSGVQLYSLRKEKSETRLLEVDKSSRNLETFLLKEDSENEFQLKNSKTRQNNPVHQNYSNDIRTKESNSERQYLNYQSKSISVDE